MGRTVALGLQNFEDLIIKEYFYIDKTSFIKEWWESGDMVTLINRPRRFGKTLNMSMLEYFFSIEHEKQGELFEGLTIWREEQYRKIQGTYPVISLSFANVKEKEYEKVSYRIRQLLMKQYEKNTFLLESDVLSEAEKSYFIRMKTEMSEIDAAMSLYQLSDFLYRYYGKKVIILLDEYDTPMQEAYVDGFWEKFADFIRSLFNSTFKTNPWLERAVMTGITRVSKESVFSDLNNLEVVTTTSEKYTASFGFTEAEVFDALEECGLAQYKKEVKEWYDGFIFGKQKDIYNPWSVLNFLDKGKLAAYWANTSANTLISKLMQEGNREIKEKFETLLKGDVIWTEIDEQIIYKELDDNESAIWSLLLASGYLKVLNYEQESELGSGELPKYELAITNYEVRRMFNSMVTRWFKSVEPDYNDFVKAMLQDDIDAMNEYMNRVALKTFSYFDTGSRDGVGAEPERFYHGFLLGMLVELQSRYDIQSNKESGFGRYDVMLKPHEYQKDDAIILEFKVRNRRKEKDLEDTVKAALQQIEEKKYEAGLVACGIPKKNIRCYGFAFQGKEILIGSKEEI